MDRSAAIIVAGQSKMGCTRGEEFANVQVASRPSTPTLCRSALLDSLVRWMFFLRLLRARTSCTSP